METLTLYIDSFWISPYALSSFVALEEKGLAYKLVEISLADKEQASPSYLARTGRVPALRHGDYWLAESQAITEYLAETFPFPTHPRLFPADLRQRGVCREVMAWLRSDLVPIREERSTHTVWYQHTFRPLSPAGEEARTRLVRYAEGLIVENRATIFPEWCIADCDLTMMLQRLHRNGDELPKKLVAYAESNWARPSMRKWNEHARRPYVHY